MAEWVDQVAILIKTPEPEEGQRPNSKGSTTSEEYYRRWNEAYDAIAPEDPPRTGPSQLPRRDLSHESSQESHQSSPTSDSLDSIPPGTDPSQLPGRRSTPEITQESQQSSSSNDSLASQGSQPMGADVLSSAMRQEPWTTHSTSQRDVFPSQEGSFRDNAFPSLNRRPRRRKASRTSRRPSRGPNVHNPQRIVRFRRSHQENAVASSSRDIIRNPVTVSSGMYDPQPPPMTQSTELGVSASLEHSSVYPYDDSPRGPNFQYRWGAQDDAAASSSVAGIADLPNSSLRLLGEDGFQASSGMDSTKRNILRLRNHSVSRLGGPGDTALWNQTTASSSMGTAQNAGDNSNSLMEVDDPPPDPSSAPRVNKKPRSCSYLCRYCKKSFPNKKALTSHCALHHPHPMITRSRRTNRRGKKTRSSSRRKN
ncbi:hypothetical protein Hypma_005300 [Hypsizygus marmoreus]|uniref:C2H2-type domain-containing protein n=1 Tax=Hypsizygus marmoreus TaxID=39966 RepID=A0A369JYI0_HYPMA|nr:hypothetical protein Hypma_005300 [Hypsizygus marmoreus]